MSRLPGTSEATMGLPAAMASSRARDVPSYNEAARTLACGDDSGHIVALAEKQHAPGQAGGIAGRLQGRRSSPSPATTRTGDRAKSSVSTGRNTAWFFWAAKRPTVHSTGRPGGWRSATATPDRLRPCRCR